MKIVFISNFLNHHQIPLCRAFVSKGVELTFVSCENLPSERRRGGYQDFSDLNYNLNYNKQTEKIIYKKIIEADCIIFGSGNKKILNLCMQLNKLILLYLEHTHKRNIPKFINDFTRYKSFKKFYNYNKAYLLCASAYVKNEFERIRLFKGKCFYWGYFPEVEFNKKPFIERQTDFLWCGRLLSWKKPFDFIWLSKKLQNKGLKFEIYGDGKLRENIERLLNKEGSNVFYGGPLFYKEVLFKMEQAKYFIFSSNKHEGWGSVLNEALASGCIVFANKFAGSVKNLIIDNYNGFVYKNRKELLFLVNKVCNLTSNEREKISLNAIETIKETWNANVAAENLLINIENILQCKSLKMSKKPVPGLAYFYKNAMKNKV